MLTFDQALIELAELTAPGKTYTAKQLADLAAKVSVDVASGSTQGSVTLLTTISTTDSKPISS